MSFVSLAHLTRRSPSMIPQRGTLGALWAPWAGGGPRTPGQPGWSITFCLCLSRASALGVALHGCGAHAPTGVLAPPRVPLWGILPPRGSPRGGPLAPFGRLGPGALRVAPHGGPCPQGLALPLDGLALLAMHGWPTNPSDGTPNTCEAWLTNPSDGTPNTCEACPQAPARPSVINTACFA